MTTMRGTIALLALTVLLACDDDDPMVPTSGTVEVEVETTGDGTDADGYVAVLDEGEDSEDVEVSGTASFEVEAGEHSVELTDVAENCTVDGDNPVTVDVAASETETVAFDVTCTDGS